MAAPRPISAPLGIAGLEAALFAHGCTMRVNRPPMKKPVRFFLLLAWACLLNGCTTLGEIDPPILHLADLTLTEVTLFEQRYQLQFRVQNPNPVDLPIDGIAYILELNGKPFAKGVGNHAVTVPRYGTALLEVEGISTLQDILRQTNIVEKGKAEHAQYRLSGKLSIAGKQLPFDYQGDF